MEFERHARQVVVIGGGNAALCAALAARRAGADVLLLEAATKARRGGNSKYVRNLRCVHEADPLMEGTYSEEELLHDLRSVCGNIADGELARLVAHGSRETVSWIELNGGRWQPALERAIQVSRTNRFFLGGGEALINAYYQTAEKLGVEIAYGHKVCELAFTGDECTGLVAVREAGYREIEPLAVVVASGGFEANIAWLREHWGNAVDNFVVRGARENDGAVLRSLLDSGARSCGDPRQFHAIAVDARSPRFDGGIATRIDSIPFSIVVNQNGARFHDEGEDLWPKRYARWGELIATQPNQVAYSVFDARVRRVFMDTLYEPIEAASIEELASLINVPPDRLRQTVASYNRSIRPGTFDPSALDDCSTCGLNPPKSHWALPIEVPPFFAYPVIPGITFTYLGVEVAPNGQVRKYGEQRIFRNIFAAGEIMSGNILSRGYLAGIGMTIGTVMGRIAGESAASCAGA